MARLGVIVSVSEYSGSPKNLPACDQDAAAIGDILRNSGRFDDILALSGPSNTTSLFVKNRLSEFADKHRSSNIEEIVFYFSGHGDFDGDDFLYILSDFDSKKKNKTSLSNSELDGIFRALSPDLFVKIVDACHSGISYVKNEGLLEEHLKSLDNKFNNVYFMFSSQSDEASYATAKISHFTKSIVTAVAEAPPGPVRYRDIMSAASDEFENAGGQTPLFVVQANNTEVFCESSESLTTILDRYISANYSLPIPAGKALSLRDRILSAENSFCTRDEAAEIMQSLIKTVEGFRIDPQIDGLYDLSVEPVDDVPSSSTSIGRWIDENKSTELFAEAIKTKESYLDKSLAGPFGESNSILKLLQAGNPKGEAKTPVLRTRLVISGYKVTTGGMPFVYIKVKLNSKVKAVAPVECHITPILSRTRMTIFYRYRQFTYTDWEDTSPISTTSWARSDTSLKDETDREHIIGKILEGFTEFALAPLLEQYPDPQKDPDSDSDSEVNPHLDNSKS